MEYGLCRGFRAHSLARAIGGGAGGSRPRSRPKLPGPISPARAGVCGPRAHLVDHADDHVLDLDNIVAPISNSTLPKTMLPGGYGAFENGPKNRS